ncbi:prepilin peptidase [Modestobacter sp. I12A-02628]|uniref:Prepilin peptidase n=1 Tax=Goekera deserti TaxID=2497753 RepID=A0A7K3WAS0_9ACTN|nr:A24 family peptidase [Goekera deserti]MPQ97576.1 prepilin peptidase [Goekera deserti]NDI47820.1 prepilin peptidase [Goekera deserti]NEL53568.1 prepilin peptidase [Goekera deserti]
MTPVLVASALVAGAVLGRVVDHRAVRSLSPVPVPVGGPPAAPSHRVRVVGAPLPELVGGVLAAVLVLRLGVTVELVPWLWFLAVGVLLAIVDLAEQRLPNRVVLPGIVVALVLFTGSAAFDDGWPALRRAVLAAGACYLVLLVMVLVAPTGMGMGDVKLAAFLGLYLGWLGWPVVLAGFWLAFVLQAVLALGLLAARRVGRKADLPFGPALLGGTLLALLLTDGWALLPR